MSERAAILVVDDERAQREIIADILRAAGHQPTVASDVGGARAALEAGEWDLVLTDWRMPDGGGRLVLEDARRLCDEAPVIVMTAYGSIAGAVEAVRLGACDYLSKPFEKDGLLLAVDKGLKHRALTAENRRLRAERSHGDLDKYIIGKSIQVNELKRLIARASRVGSSVLVSGESGVGKELVARCIHRFGTRSDGPFVALNCAALPPSLIESELFGHEKGAFTGAERQVRGKFEQAHGGTLLLDEVGSLPLDMQGKLLRALQEREFTRVGGDAPVRVDVRILAATNRDLAEAVRAGQFREDLYYRLHVLPIVVPPLRDRAGDIPLLAGWFLDRLASQLGGGPKRLSSSALEALERHVWPGNVRELENVLERLWVTTDAALIDAAAVADALRGTIARPLPTGGRSLHPHRAGAAVEFLQGAGLTMDGLEARLIREALERNGGHIRAAADMLGLSYKTMQYRIRKYGIAPRAWNGATDERLHPASEPRKPEGGRP